MNTRPEHQARPTNETASNPARSARWLTALFAGAMLVALPSAAAGGFGILDGILGSDDCLDPCDAGGTTSDPCVDPCAPTTTNPPPTVTHTVTQTGQPTTATVTQTQPAQTVTHTAAPETKTVTNTAPPQTVTKTVTQGGGAETKTVTQTHTVTQTQPAPTVTKTQTVTQTVTHTQAPDDDVEVHTGTTCPSPCEPPQQSECDDPCAQGGGLGLPVSVGASVSVATEGIDAAASDDGDFLALCQDVLGGIFGLE